MNFFQLNEAIENFIGYKIYCDLDGVLVDLEGGLKEEMGLHDHLSRLEILKDLHKLERDGHDLNKFFAELPWMEDGKKLWQYILPYTPTIITAASHKHDPAIVTGKYKWCKRELELPKDRVIMEPLKEHYAAPKSILIDDWSRNIKHWESAGGIGILHKSAAETIGQLKDLVGKRKEEREKV